MGRRIRQRAATNEPGRRRAVWAVCAMVAALAAGVAGAQDSTIEFVTPRNLSTAIGPSRIELRVTAAPGLTTERVDLTVDGTPLVSLDRPPWDAQWNAGDGSHGHRIEAVARFSDGTTDRLAVRTSPLRINQVMEVGLVNLYPVVRKQSGGYVTDLTRDDFRILEDGVEQKISRFTAERRPLRIGIVLDTSLSMEDKGKLDKARKAALEFLDIFEPNDQGLVVAFSDNVRVLQGITSSSAKMAAAIESVEAEGGTALYDAVWRTSKMLEAFDGRRVLVLLSDGRDEASNGFEPGSLHTLEEALDQALRSEVMIFSIGLGPDLDRQYDFQGKFTREEVLHKFSGQTGGRLLLSPRAGRLRNAFEEVADDLRNQYSIAYKSTNQQKDGEWRRVLVTTRDPDFEVRCRSGYYASSEDASLGRLGGPGAAGVTGGGG